MPSTLSQQALPKIVSNNLTDALVYEGQAKKWRVIASRGRGLQYQWQVNSGTGWSNVGGATSANYTTATLTRSADNGKLYRCIVSNSAGRVIVGPATITVWNPTARGSDTIWLDPSFGLFSERTGASATTASTNGGVVGTWRDAAGTRNGVTNADDQRPLRRNTEHNNFPGIEFDGTDDRFVFTAAMADAVRNKAFVYIFGTVRTEASATERAIIAFANNATSSRVFVGVNGGGVAGTLLAGGRRLDANSFASASLAGSHEAIETFTFGAEFLFSTAQLHLRKNGVRIASNNSFQTAGSTSDTASGAVHVGARPDGTAGFFDGLIGDIVIVTPSLVLTTAEIATIEAFCAARAGFPLLDWNLSSRTTGVISAATVTSAVVTQVNGSSISENDPTTHKYRHQTAMAFAFNRLHLAFTSSGTNEDAGGQQIIYAYSDNKGATWSSLSQLVPSQSTWSNTGAAFAVNSHIANVRKWINLDGRLFFVSAVDLCAGDPPGYNGLTGVFLCAREVLSNGSFGALFRVSPADYTALDGKPKLDYDTVLGPQLFREANVFGIWGGSHPDYPASAWTGWVRQDGVDFTEIVATQADEDSDNLIRVLRDFSGTTGAVYVQRSTDAGVTWGRVTRTNIPSSPSLCYVMRLNDGRMAVLGNVAANRTELYVAILNATTFSLELIRYIKTGVSFTPASAGSYKGGGAAYPFALQRGNYLYVSWSERKEDIYFGRVLIPGLSDNNNDG